MNTKKGKLFTLLVSFAVILLLSGVDQLIKFFVERDLKPVGSVVVIKNVLAFTYVKNDGAMMGFLGGNVSFLAVFSLLIIIALFCFIVFGKLRVSIPYICIVTILSGGIGNVIDRIFRGYVVDYIEALFVQFYVFNFADMLITCSCITLIIYEIYKAVIEARDRRKANA